MVLELVLALIAFAVFSLVVWLAALPATWPLRRSHESERVAWWRLVFPLFVGALVISFLLGWAIQEGDPADERVGTIPKVLALVSCAVVLRACYRAATAVRLGELARVPIGTIGLLNPRVVVSDEFRKSVSSEVLAAALAHERAHVRGRDPLRIWLAQFAADLQWPVPRTAQRFSAWLVALEAERDDEALANGASGEDLADAILTAARFHVAAATRPCAYVEGAGGGVAWRVRRLLSATRPTRPLNWQVRWLTLASCLVLLASAVGLGTRYGDCVLGMLPGVGP